MNFKYLNYNAVPDLQLATGITKLQQTIFGDSENLIREMESKPQLLINIALDGTRVIGYKIGYALDNEKFYCWLGGVAADYRNFGIAFKLMKMQHDYLIEHRFKRVQTKTMNKWRSMLILNIKNGFDVIGKYTDKNGELKIILEKELKRNQNESS